MLRRVTFMYPTDIEVRYVETIPEVGSRVTSSVGDAFVVQAVRRDAVGWNVVAVREDESRRARVQPAEQPGRA
jgi:hypothetical protein